MQRNINKMNFPYAVANILGSDKYSKIKGRANLYCVKNGTLFKVEVEGMPDRNKNNFFGFHIHENSECENKRRYCAI